MQRLFRLHIFILLFFDPPKDFSFTTVKPKTRLLESQLVEQLKLRDEAAFSHLVERSRNRVFNTVLQIVQNTDDADDISQEVFIRVYHSVQKFRGDSSLDTWLYRIAIRLSIDHLRKKKRQENLKKWIAVLKGQPQPGAEEWFYHPGAALDKKEKAAELFKALNDLPEKQQVAFTLIKIEGLSYEEAASVMQQNIKAIESLVTRAKLKLQKTLSAYQLKHRS